MLAKRTIIILFFLLFCLPANAALNDNLNLVLDFENANRGTDTSGTGLNFSTTGTIVTAAGKIGAVAIIPDCTNFLQLAHASSGALSVSSGSFSVSYWIKTGAFTGSGHMVLAKRTSSGNGWWTNIIGDGTAGLTIDSGTSDTVVSGGAVNIENSNWHHVVSVSDQSVPQVRHYVDGALDGQGGVSLRNISNTDAVRVGCHAGNTNPLSETVDQIAFWSRALTLSDAQALYNSGDGITLPEESEAPVFMPRIIIGSLNLLSEIFF
jgi:hypothetical protein